jgi:hypothetical protein
MLKSGIIGTGDWSDKVAKSLVTNFEVSVYSARAIISAQESLEFSEDLIWLATRNTEQLQITEQILNSGYQGKIILEKPYFTSIREREHLLSLIQLNPHQIFLSQVWKFSALWMDFSNYLIKSSESFDISIVRCGNKLRSDFVPPFDWIPHDLYLLLDLTERLNSVISGISVSQGLNGNLLEVTAKISFQNRVNMMAGYSETRINTWDVRMQNGNTLEINFLENHVLLNGELLLIESLSSGSKDVPILNFANWVLSCDQDLLLEKLLKLNSDVLLGMKMEG